MKVLVPSKKAQIKKWKGPCFKHSCPGLQRKSQYPWLTAEETGLLFCCSTSTNRHKRPELLWRGCPLLLMLLRCNGCRRVSVVRDGEVWIQATEYLGYSLPMCSAGPDLCGSLGEHYPRRPVSEPSQHPLRSQCPRQPPIGLTGPAQVREFSKLQTNLNSSLHMAQVQKNLGNGKDIYFKCTPFQEKFWDLKTNQTKC